MLIYKITNTVNNKTYIGQHNGKRESYFGGGKLLRLAIKKYGKEKFTKQIIINNILTQEESNHLEKFYIFLYKSNDVNFGYNIQKGGKGEYKHIVTEEFIEGVRKRMIGNKIMLGRKRSEYSKIKQSNTIKTICANRTCEEKRISNQKAVATRNSKYDFGKLISKGRKKNIKLDWNNKQIKPVIQETLDGQFIKLWASAYQAQKETSIYRSSNISGVCYKKYGQKTYKGYNWRFASEEEIKELHNT